MTFHVCYWTGLSWRACSGRFTRQAALAWQQHLEYEVGKVAAVATLPPI